MDTLRQSSSLKSRINSFITFPNLISLLRIVMAIIVLWLLIIFKQFIFAACILAMAGITDFLDGYIARHTNSVSELGKVLDPVADRVLLIGASLGVIIDGLIPDYLIIPIVIREGIMSLATIILALFKTKRIDVIWLGKAGTFLLMVSVPCFVLGKGFSSHSGLYDFYWAGYVVAIPAIALAWLATFSYIPKMVRVLKEKRVEKR